MEFQWDPLDFPQSDPIKSNENPVKFYAHLVKTNGNQWNSTGIH